jgi:hypothetical protein
MPQFGVTVRDEKEMSEIRARAFAEGFSSPSSWARAHLGLDKEVAGSIVSEVEGGAKASMTFSTYTPRDLQVRQALCIAARFAHDKNADKDKRMPLAIKVLSRAKRWGVFEGEPVGVPCAPGPFSDTPPQKAVRSDYSSEREFRDAEKGVKQLRDQYEQRRAKYHADMSAWADEMKKLGCFFPEFARLP